MTPRRPWSASEIKVLRELYPDFSAAHVGRELGRLPGSVYAKATLLKLKKSPGFLDTVRSGRIQRGQKSEAMKASQFQAGHVTWNKGTSYHAGGRSAETQFRGGNRPHTWRPVGTYRVVTDNSTKQQYLHQKISDQAGPPHVRWRPVSRIVWEAVHGPTQAGHLVVFKRGMATIRLEEITIDRLECITRAEIARRNHPMQISPEFAMLVQLKGAINRQVNNIIRKHEEAQRP